MRLSVPRACNAFHLTYLRLIALLEERVLTRLVGSLAVGEVTVLADLVQNLGVDARQVNRGGGSDNISGVYPSQRNAVDFEGTGDEEDTLGKVLEEDDTLAAETTGEEDDDGAGLERGPGFRRSDSLTSLKSQSAESLAMQLLFPSLFMRMHSHCVNVHPQLQQSSSCRCYLVVSRRTYLLQDGDILRRVILAGLLGLLFLFVGRHFELLLSLVALGVGCSSQ